MQLLVHTLCSAAPASQTALIITPKPANVILGTLRACLAKELAEQGVPASAARTRMKDCLDSIMLSCVFDVDGLWEVLADLDKPDDQPGSQLQDQPEGLREELAGKTEGKADEVMSSPLSSPLSSPMSSPPSSWRPSMPDVVTREFPASEIQDSQDEDDLSPLPSSPPQPEKPNDENKQEAAQTTTDHEAASSKSLPHIILVTHFSSLLTGLFTHRENSAAHNALQLLGSHMRYLSQNLASSPLIMLLNSTTASTDPVSNVGVQNAANPDSTKPIDPTLCSVFNPPSLPLAGPHYAAGAAAARRNKPRFGLIFAQLLDMHLLATRVPRSKQDADIVYGPPAPMHANEVSPGPHNVHFVTVIEVLLDEMGLWEGKTGPRKSREQRWTAIDVKEGRVVDAFAKKDKVAVHDEIRLAAGFGGPRV